MANSTLMFFSFLFRLINKNSKRQNSIYPAFGIDQSIPFPFSVNFLCHASMNSFKISPPLLVYIVAVPIQSRLGLCSQNFRVSVNAGHESQSNGSANGFCNFSLVDRS